MSEKKKQMKGWSEVQAVKALGPGAKVFRIYGEGLESEYRYHAINKMDDGRMVGGHGRTPAAALAMARSNYSLWQSTPTASVKEQA